MIRWWNAGRYERECAEFDATQPLSREVWESLQRMGVRWSCFADFVVHPRDSLIAREPEPDPWDQIVDRIFREQMIRWFTANPVNSVGV